MKLDNRTDADLAEFSKLLVSAELVPVGLNNKNLQLFCHRDDSGHIVGVVGVGIYRNGGLLRSLAVREDMRHQGIARSLLQEAYEFAGRNNCHHLYLLTETIGETMKRYGFSDILRKHAPSELLASPFFNGICPCSSRLMHKNIQEE